MFFLVILSGAAMDVTSAAAVDADATVPVFVVCLVSVFFSLFLCAFVIFFSFIRIFHVTISNARIFIYAAVVAAVICSPAAHVWVNICERESKLLFIE